MISQLNKHNEFKRIVSPLKYQTRCVTAFPDQQGFLVFASYLDHRNCSTEVRVGVHHLDDSQQNKNFTFKYHRDGNEIYSINALNFHPHETVVSEAAAPASAPHVANSMGSASAAPPVANMAFASCNSQSKAFQEVILSSLLQRVTIHYKVNFSSLVHRF
ncbi:hypothetical protein HID58_039722 [Brassica napus]|uniref:Uncharacterized protein n=1 Tax=Brassica napus TaxID=3708 RepID=A0ABQ8BST2_BRANA|nr:hypothetical protein HID58_039722 [Brassica napus]